MFGHDSFRRLTDLAIRDFPSLVSLRTEAHALSEVVTLDFQQLPEFTSIFAAYYSLSHVKTLELTSMK